MTDESRQVGADRDERVRLVVGVGASAGGLQAFKELLDVLPAESGMAFVFIQHLHPSHESLLPALLAPCTEMTVVEASDGAMLEPDTVYVIRPGTTLGVRGGCLELPTAKLHRGVRLPVDHLFRSLAREFGSRAVGIVLSGAGSDGSAGLREIKAVRGLAIAQRPDDAGDRSMPQSAIDTGLVDFVVPIREIPAALERFSALPALALEDTSEGATQRAVTEDQLRRIATIVERRVAIDLTLYKSRTVERRVLRRMGLSALDTVEVYIRQLSEDASEQERLCRDLLIGVTDFFRDPEAFEELRTNAIESLVRDLRPGGNVRAWIAGCTTGEEAYTLAILLLEALDREGKTAHLQLFATDVDVDALAVARQGIYPASISEHVDSRLLEKYFTALDGRGYRVKARLRDTLSFAVHDLCKDPPFSAMDLASCRNVLIYLRRETQERVLQALHFSLVPDGVLFLGTSESLGTQRQLFSVTSKKARVYRKRGSSYPLTLRSTATGWTTPAAGHAARAGPRRGRSDAVLRSVLAARVPPTIVVADDDIVLYAHGDLEPYLTLPEGEPSLTLASLVRRPLSTRVRAAIYRCRRSGETVVANAVTEPSESRTTRITASPAAGLGEGFVVITFEAETTGGTRSVATEEPTCAPDVVAQLESELQATRDDLRHTVEELETTNEELKASSEESRSMNEELQSSNEELEATTEELRSVNEELTTVNAQLRDKVEELQEAHDDLGNFFQSAKVSILFLDDSLRIVRFTPAAGDLLEIDHSSVGRPVSDLARELLQDGLAEEARGVLANLAPSQAEIQRVDGACFVRKVLPYRTETRRIEGIVVTFVDVTDLKRVSALASARERRQAVLARLGMQALEEGDLQEFLERVVREVSKALEVEFTKILELQPEERILFLRAGVGWEQGSVGTTTVPSGHDSQAGYTLRSRTPVVVEDFAAEHRFHGAHLLVSHGVTSGVSCVIRDGKRPYGVIGVHTRQRRSFSPDEVDFVQTIATLVAAAVSRHLVRKRIALEVAIGQAQADADDLEDLASAVHHAFAREVGTSVGELWWRNDRGGAVERIVLSVDAPHTLSEVRECLPEESIAPGQGFVGRVLEQGRAEWLTSFSSRDVRARFDEASALGLLTGFAFPIVVGPDVQGVMALYSTSRAIADEAFLGSLAVLGRTIGEFARLTDVERALRENEERKAAILDAAPDAIITTEADGAVVEFNRSAQVLFGHARSEAIGAEMVKLVIPSRFRQSYRRLVERQLDEREGASAARRELRALRADGSEFPAEVTVARLEGPHGTLHTNFFRDVSYRTEAEEALRLSETRFRGIFESAGVSLWEEDFSAVRAAIEELRGEGVEDLRRYCSDHPDFVERAIAAVRIRDVNPETLQLFGAESKQQLLGSLDTIFTAETRETFVDEIVALAEGVQQHGGEARLRRVDGEPLDVTFTIRFPSPEDSSARTFVSIMDTTERKRAEAQLREINRQKDQFIAMLGHELRNPLAGIHSASELLSSTDEGKREQAQEILRRQCRQMTHLIDGLLDVSRVIRGKIVLSREAVDFGKLVHVGLGDAERRVGQRDIELCADLAPAPVYVEGDPVRLAQIVENLLSNALKYTEPPGRITVSVAAVDGMAELRVTDTGIGISSELLPYVFDAFRQSEQSLARSDGGLGLGLALVRSLVELHGGSIEAHSAGEGSGSEFRARLPLATSEVAEAPVETGGAAAERPARLGILLVEDNPDAGLALRYLLEARGHDVALVETGAAALRAIEEDRPDVVLCDLGLPGDIDGFDLARHLHRDEADGRPFLVAITGYVRPEDRRRSAAAGFDAHLAKPVDLSELERLLASVR